MQSKLTKILSSVLICLFVLTANQAARAEKAIFAGGCFWCMEADFQDMKGVLQVVSGFIGGTALNPTYNGNHLGHYEAVEIIYDPEVVTFQQLLNRYWVNIDPFDARGQFCDKGPSYRAAIFYLDEGQKELADTSKQAVVEEFSTQVVVTEILKATTFYPIKGRESYHQDYYINYALRYKVYRYSCGRDSRLRKIWGDRVTH